MGIVIVGILQASGYVYGANLFGKYIRRAQVNTVPEYFGKRFSSRRLRMLATVTLMVAVTAYMLSAIGVMSVYTSGYAYYNNIPLNNIQLLEGCLYVCLRLRNNLFHGVKLYYSLDDQIEIFKALNNLLEEILKS